jgi:zinc transport system substrate-binding protein
MYYLVLHYFRYSQGNGVNTYIKIFVFVLAALCLPASSAPQALEKLDIFVGIPPLAYIAENIGGDQVNCHVLLEPGESPHTFEPTPRQMIELSRAAFYFELGFPFESRITSKLGNGDKPRVVDISQGVRIRHMHATHQEEDINADSEYKDPHIWLAPDNIRVMAKNIKKTLEHYDPANSSFYNSRLAAFIHNLDSIDDIIDSMLKPYEGTSIMVFHPAFGYFTESYGLKQLAVESEGKSPGPRQIRSIITRARENNIKVIFVQPQFDPKSAESIAHAIGGKMVTFDPLAGNLIDNLMK